MVDSKIIDEGKLIGIYIKDLRLSDCKLNVIGKGNKERIVYINDACRRALDAYLSVRSFTVERGEFWAASSIWRLDR